MPVTLNAARSTTSSVLGLPASDTIAHCANPLHIWEILVLDVEARSLGKGEDEAENQPSPGEQVGPEVLVACFKRFVDLVVIHSACESQAKGIP